MTRVTNIYKAKRLVGQLMDAEGIKFERLTARTVSFADLARGTAIYVKPHGVAVPDHRLLLIKARLKETGVYLDPNL